MRPDQGWTDYFGNVHGTFWGMVRGDWRYIRRAVRSWWDNRR